MALNGCSFPPFLRVHMELYRNKLCTWIMQIKADSRKMTSSVTAAVKKLLEHKLVWCFLGSFWTEPDKQNGEAAFSARITPE